MSNQKEKLTIPFNNIPMIANKDCDYIHVCVKEEEDSKKTAPP